MRHLLNCLVLLNVAIKIGLTKMITKSKQYLIKELYLQCKREAQSKRRTMKYTWWLNKARKLQEAAHCKDTKSFHHALKAVYGPKTNGIMPVLAMDGKTLLNDKSKVLNRWKEHFEDLNRHSTVNEDSCQGHP